MRLPTFQVVDGVVDPISTHGDSIRLVGAGRAQPIPGKMLLGKDAIGYLADCIYRTEDAALNLIPLSWTLQIYAHLTTNITILASHDAQVAAGGWVLTMGSSSINFYRNLFNGSGYYLDLIFSLDFPEGLNKNEPKHYALVKDANRVSVYVNYKLARTFSFPTNVGSPGFSMFGITGGKDTYNSASSLYCNFIRLDHNYVTPVDEFTRFDAAIPREVALSFFDTEAVSPQAFDKVHLKGVRNFSPPLKESDFAGAVGIIPPLTADVGAVYVTAASDVYSATYPAWKAFPGGNYVPTSTALWASSTAAGDKWLSIRRVDNQPFLVNAFRVNDGTIDGYRGLDYTLQGKMQEDAQWTDLYSVTDVPNTPDLSHYFTNIGNHNYSNYRLLFTKYALVNKRMAVSLFQLYFVESVSGSKSFELSNNAKEVTLVGQSTETGNYIKSFTFSGEGYPRTFNVVLNDNSVLNAGQQEVIDLGLSFPWGNTGGYLAKDAQGNYYTKPMVFEGFDVMDNNGEKTLTYPAASSARYSIDGLDEYAIKALPATEFMKVAASVWTAVPLENKKLDSSEVISTTIRRLTAGRYLVRGFVTLTTPAGAACILTTVDGVTLLQSLGGYSGKLGDSTLQIPFNGIINLAVDTDVILKVYAVVATRASLSLPSKVLIKSEHTKLNFFKV